MGCCRRVIEWFKKTFLEALAAGVVITLVGGFVVIATYGAGKIYFGLDRDFEAAAEKAKEKYEMQYKSAIQREAKLVEEITETRKELEKFKAESILNFERINQYLSKPAEQRPTKPPIDPVKLKYETKEYDPEKSRLKYTELMSNSTSEALFQEVGEKVFQYKIKQPAQNENDSER